MSCPAAPAVLVTLATLVPAATTLLLADPATTACNCAKLTASVLFVPAATLVILLPPALMPVVVTLGPPLMVRPSLLMVMLPVVTVFTAKSWAVFTVYVSLPSAPVVELTTMLLPSVTLVFEALAAAFNCATFTASVATVPAATPVIWRVSVPSALPTDTAALVAFQVGLVSAEALPVFGS